MGRHDNEPNTAHHHHHHRLHLRPSLAPSFTVSTRSILLHLLLPRVAGLGKNTVIVILLRWIGRHPFPESTSISKGMWQSTVLILQRRRLRCLGCRKRRSSVVVTSVGAEEWILPATMEPLDFGAKATATAPIALCHTNKKIHVTFTSRSSGMVGGDSGGCFTIIIILCVGFFVGNKY